MAEPVMVEIVIAPATQAPHIVTVAIHLCLFACVCVSECLSMRIYVLSDYSVVRGKTQRTAKRPSMYPHVLVQ